MNPARKRVIAGLIMFDTSEYERSHGKPPRGRGAWAFDFGVGPEWIRDPVKGSSLTYSEAKAIARKLGAERQIEDVKVCS